MNQLFRQIYIVLLLLVLGTGLGEAQHGDYHIVVKGFDWGAAVYKVILPIGQPTTVDQLGELSNSRLRRSPGNFGRDSFVAASRSD